MFDLSSIPPFSNDDIEKMNSLFIQKSKESTYRHLFVNKILREDIFDILEEYCTVVFYPLEAEENDGFHVSIPVDYQEQNAHFVYINTQKTIEKQVFAAAHELGHIWGLEEILWGNDAHSEVPKTHQNIEAAMNRFAAEVLMPKDEFLDEADRIILPFISDGKAHITDFMRAIVSLMNEFCVPFQAVLCRLYEVQRISGYTCKTLLENQQTKILLESIIQESGFVRLNQATCKKGIKDFPRLLDKAEESGFFTKQRVESLRNKLDIPKIEKQDRTIDISK